MPDHSTSRRFTARELAERADTTVRTVHYYVAEGLLPPPDGTTRNALYGADHLARLRIIAALRSEGLSLAAIRSRLALLDGDGVVEILRTLDRFAAEIQAGEVPVLGLIEAAVVDRSSETSSMAENAPSGPEMISGRGGTVREPDAPDSARAYVERMLRRSGGAQPVRPRQASLPRPGRPPETWHHFTIEEGIEVRVRDDRLRPERRQVEAFMDAVRDLARRSIRRRDN